VGRSLPHTFREHAITTPPTPPAGWYADPSGSPAQRWWDGATWSEHLREVAVAQPVVQPRYGELAPGHVVPTDPYGQPPAQQGGIPQHPYGDPGNGNNANQTPRGAYNNRAAWMSLIFGIISAAIAISDTSPTSTSIVASTIGIWAVVNGIRAINHYKAGISNNLWAPVIGTILGALGTLVMFSIFFASH
jgi:Protein of unknown function (DUF2510)